jgi:hypothetical protein
MSAASSLRTIARNAKSFPRKFVEDSAKSVNKAIDRRLVSDTGGDRVLSGTTRSGKVGKLTVKSKIDGQGSVVTGTITPAGPRGPWAWIEEGTGPPGPTRAKHTWTKAATPAVEALQREARRAFESVLKQ